jgi:hypothetical protein
VRSLRGRNGEVEAQSRSERDRRTFYETIIKGGNRPLRGPAEKKIKFVAGAKRMQVPLY